MDIILNYDGDNFSWILIQECCDFLQCVQCTSLMDFPNNTFLRTTHMNQLKPFNWWIERERERERVWVALQRLWSWNIAHETNGRARCHSRNHTYPTSIPSLHSKEENQSRFLKKGGWNHRSNKRYSEMKQDSVFRTMQVKIWVIHKKLHTLSWLVTESSWL